MTFSIDYRPCGSSSGLVFHVNLTCDGAAQCPQREDESHCRKFDVTFHIESVNMIANTFKLPTKGNFNSLVLVQA